MILELDCGNTLIKWRFLEGSAPSDIRVAETPEQLAAALPQLPERIRMVSVRSDAETLDLCTRLQVLTGCEVEMARPARQLAGVSNGYEEYERLGMDRWLALVAGFARVRGSCLVIDVGTAITVDAVDAEGRHLGGFITPGISLLRRQLLANTQRVTYAADEVRVLQQNRPGCSTADAVERGLELMVAGYLQYVIQSAPEYLGSEFEVLLTGGDGHCLAGLTGVQLVPDLVFQGLGLACP